MTIPDRLAEFFETHPRGVTAAYLFGSHAEGGVHRESDIDVAVLLDRVVFPREQKRAEQQIVLGSELIGALHHNEIDVVILNDAPPLFAREIVRRGRVVYCADSQALRGFVRDTQLMAADIEPFIERHRRRLLEALTK